MSSPTLSGFDWPSPASTGPQVTESAVPEKPSATLKVSSTATVISQQEKTTSGSGAPPVSISVVLPPSASTMSSIIPGTDSFSLPQGPQNVRVQVTSIINVTPSVPTSDIIVPKSLVGEPRHTSDAGLVHTSTPGPTPETAVAFQTYKEESSNHMAIAGGIFGALAFILLVVLLIVFCRRKNRYDSKRSQAEKGKARSGNKPATQDVLNEALQRRQDRNRRTATFNAQASVLTPADMSEMMHQGNVMAAEYHAQHSSKSYQFVQRPIHAVSRQGSVRAYPIAATPSQRHSLSDASVSHMGRSFDIVDLENISPLSSPTGFIGNGRTH
ncbi:hypothetical protein BDU57DRAFT_541559 [Ampelomyces quisqualis]|uniref:Uncharacterized protein n=1 Tax=Ampelomyces quisqualis TaxID=50730 RepID=A0A6A5QED0_AMPQU|nr:hypothetical protein BDU57DRAFT_541559 [Ampelomyces quisqualis]